MPPTQTDEGMQIAERLRKSRPRVGVVPLSQHESLQYAAELLASGAAGRACLLKDPIRDLDHIVSTNAAVAGGKCRIDTRRIDELVAHRRTTATFLFNRLRRATPLMRRALAPVLLASIAALERGDE